MSVQDVLDKLDRKEDDVIWLPWVMQPPARRRSRNPYFPPASSRHVEYELIERIPVRASALAKCIREFDAERRAYYAGVRPTAKRDKEDVNSQ